MKHTISILLLVFCSNTWADELIGTWALTVESPRGTRDVAFTVRKQGDGLAGTLKGNRSNDVPNIKRSGNDFTFTLERETPRGAMTLSYSGKIDGDKLAGVIEARFGEIPFTGVRQTAADTETAN